MCSLNVKDFFYKLVLCLLFIPNKMTFCRDEIPFVNAAPIDEAESKKAKKQKEGMKK